MRTVPGEWPPGLAVRVGNSQNLTITPQIGETKIWSGLDTVPKKLRVQRQILKHTQFQNRAVGVMIIRNEQSGKGCGGGIDPRDWGLNRAFVLLKSK